MNYLALQNYLNEHIPLSLAMGVKVEAASDNAVTLSAPLKPNINHRDTVFGGSASAVAILSAWTLLYVRLNRARISVGVALHCNGEQVGELEGDFVALGIQTIES